MDLRPTKLEQFIGNEQLKKSIGIQIKAAKIRNTPLGHTCFQGHSGCGKTTLANIIANEMGGQFHAINSTSIKKTKHLLNLVLKIKKNDIVFIDEIHRLDIVHQEFLYPIIDEFKLVLSKSSEDKDSIEIQNFIKNQPLFRTIHIPPFTLIGATTDIGLLSGPFLSRFQVQHHLDVYNKDEILQIVRMNTRQMKMNISEYAIKELAKRCKNVPRLVNNRVKFLNDYSTAMNLSKIEEHHVRDAMNMQRIDSDGLDQNDRRYLDAIFSSPKGRPVGLKTLSSMTGLTEDTISKTIEPYLINIGMIAVTREGRMLVDVKDNEYANKKLKEVIDGYATSRNLLSETCQIDESEI